MSARIAPAPHPFPPFVQEQLARLMPPDVAPLALFTTVARDERLFRRLLGGSLLDRGALTLRQREIVIDRVTARSGSEYEWGVHVAFFGAKAAFTEAELRSLVHGSADDPCWAAGDERALIRICDQLHDGCAVDDDLWAEARAHFPEPALIEILMLAGSYRMVAYLTNALRLPLEPFAARFPAAT
jgi:alkylhydroperoxidase family enzyme